MSKQYEVHKLLQRELKRMSWALYWLEFKVEGRGGTAKSAYLVSRNCIKEYHRHIVGRIRNLVLYGDRTPCTPKQMLKHWNTRARLSLFDDVDLGAGTQ